MYNVHVHLDPIGTENHTHNQKSLACRKYMHEGKALSTACMLLFLGNKSILCDFTLAYDVSIVKMHKLVGQNLVNPHVLLAYDHLS